MLAILNELTPIRHRRIIGTAFQSRLAAHPDLGAVIRGGGIRKIRVAVGASGKRGGARVIYYWAVRRDLIRLLFAYPKSASAGLSPKQVSQLGKLVREEFLG
jgi:hypothetical protein